MDKIVKEIVEKIKNEVNKNGHYRYSSGNTDLQTKQIISKIESDNKYKVTQLGDQYVWDIIKNPAYIPNVRYMLYNGIIAAILSLAVGYIQFRYQSQSTIQEVEKLSKRIDSVQNKLDSLNKKK